MANPELRLYDINASADVHHCCGFVISRAFRDSASERAPQRLRATPAFGGARLSRLRNGSCLWYDRASFSLDVFIVREIPV